MASLIPSLNTCLRKMTSGEKRFARRVETLLEDDYLCWYDVGVGPRHRHPDFVLLHPRRGLLVLEVKDWKLDTIRCIDRQQAELLTSNGLKTVSNPLEQARQYCYEVVKCLERDSQLVHPPSHVFRGRLIMPFGHGVVLANITRAQFESTDLPEVLPENRVICRDEMYESVDAEAFQERLWNMFTVQYRHALTLPQIERVRWHLFPEVRIPQGVLFDTETGNTGEPDHDPAELNTESNPPRHEVPEIVRVMDIEQERLARSLGDGHRVIHGAAGSGKTLLLDSQRPLPGNCLPSRKPRKTAFRWWCHRVRAARGHHLESSSSARSTPRSGTPSHRSPPGMTRVARGVTSRSSIVNTGWERRY